MKFLNLNSINKKLILLVMFAVLPALIILLYSGIERRQQSIENAKRDVLLLTAAMAKGQFDISRSTRQILSTLALLPEIQTMDLPASSEIFKAVLEQNPDYNNIVLLDLDGNVLTSGKTFAGNNLADRKHIREALSRKTFTVGEFIISRGGALLPIFPFAYPVFDKKGDPKAILTMAVKLASFSRFHDLTSLPDKSFVSMTDHKGIRLFYYPAQETTNPVGKAIKAPNWQMASEAKKPGIFINTGSDGLRRIFAFEQVRLTPEDDPYVYVWAGIPEAHILAPANAVLTRNILLMLLASGVAFFLSWLIGKKTLVTPIQNLVKLTRKFTEGNLEARSESMANSDEFGKLANAFHDMAEALAINQRTLIKSESELQSVFRSAPIGIGLVKNRVLKKVNEQLCLMTGYENHELIDKSARILYPTEDEFKWVGEEKYRQISKQGTGTVEIRWFKKDGKEIEVLLSSTPINPADLDEGVTFTALDISSRKQAERDREKLIIELQIALDEVKTLKGILPICSSCKKIRDDKGYWKQIESYIREHSEAEFTHSICQECAKKLYPEFVDENGNPKKDS